MNTLKLTPYIRSKLDRLPNRVGELSFSGSDLSKYDNKSIVAIVGTRKPTPYGKKITETLAEELARAGIVIVSGLALGIDGIAHSSAIKAGGDTIAVLGSGINNIYPATNKPIADEIIKSGGTIISEYPEDHQPRKVEFLQRNRIVAALSDAIIIPEAAGNSGSLNTATHAKNMNIPVCAVPGNINSPMSAGTNYLLKNGAIAITEANDVLKLLGLDLKNNQLKLDLTGETPAETLILQKISQGITNSDKIQSKSKLSTTEFQTASTMLEVQGKIIQDSLGNWSLK